MSDWATYRLADFLMFSPRVYFRLVERYNQGLWPLQLVFVAGALAILFATATDGRRARAAAMATLALAWLFCAWQFLWLRYSTINWAMSYATAAFMLQAGLLLVAIRWTQRGALPANSLRRRGGIGLMVFGSLGYPFGPLLAGRAPASAESFGAMPDPTVAVTLGALVALMPQKLWLLLPIPVLWCAFSALTLLALEDAGAWAPFAVILVTFALLLVRR
ncbi:DUF6064 family protein [Sinorhizobium meliloti]|uniref:MFS transporter permease n=1 Tax=Rhizobium meliloti TaxID=382 RepID=A0AAW9TKE2_RHIML|nr:DUF6064 family protein [Sinorhizobium meliloti]TWB00804.1 hypothetical protein FB000_10860 [Ensifer sp. SEMIA 134]TWB37457.1 hypothetical protein FB001_105176 [Ensifer sp. SEMIA 135]AEG09131.1 hypothetical protein SinmeB_4863 [Sinorhizobium meliloti BL225C]ASP55605.1 hypothetical protein CDO31_30290 [Sinorhizobium meliloti]ASP75519.1 hypothetical protein CDO28_29590 [Sinorhizobium meliloti]